MRLYFFMLSGTLIWTSDPITFGKLMTNSSYKYMGYIDPEFPVSGGPNIEPANGKNVPLG